MFINWFFLYVQSSDGLVSVLQKKFGCRVVAFGWAPFGPGKKLIENSQVDAWLVRSSSQASFPDTTLLLGSNNCSGFLSSSLKLDPRK